MECVCGRAVGSVTIDERLPTIREPRRDEAAAGLMELIEATGVLRRQLVVHETECRQVLADVEDRVPIGSALSNVRADNWRSTATEAIQRFEATRHRVRLVLVAMSLDDGASIAEVARTWGVSRQLASRWVQETRQPGRPYGALGTVAPER